MLRPRAIVVGGGISGLMASLRIAELGGHVTLLSTLSLHRSGSVTLQEGINAAMDTKKEGDSPERHFQETIRGGDFLAHQPPVKRMCEAAPGLIHMLDRIGVPFHRTEEGWVDFRRLDGSLYHRAAFAGTTTGQHTHHALAGQIRHHESKGGVTLYEGWEFLSAVLDDQLMCRGVVAMNRASMEIRAFKADAVIFCTGGLGMIYGGSTPAILSTGSAAGVLYQQGVYYANGEFIQIHPSTFTGPDKSFLISEAVVSEGGRYYVLRDKEPWYFLEEWYPPYGNLVPRDIATRAILKVVENFHLGIEGEKEVCLDVSHRDPDSLYSRLGGIVETYRKFAGQDPCRGPMRVRPNVHYSMGVLWVDSCRQMTNIPGLFAAGECDYQYHGANCLGGNALLSSLYGGRVAGESAFCYIKGLEKGTDSVDEGDFTREIKKQTEDNQKILQKQGSVNPHRLHQQLGTLMRENVMTIRHNKVLAETDEKLQEMMEQWENNLTMTDVTHWANDELIFARHLRSMLHLARVITLGAFRRNESRGAHYKPECPDRDDNYWLKMTKAKYTEKGPEFSYEEVDTSLMRPCVRDYTTSGVLV